MRKKEKEEERTKDEACDLKRDNTPFYNSESNECLKLVGWLGNFIINQVEEAAGF
jgi:hypothetical protein